MTIVTTEEISQFRSQLQDYSEAVIALDVIQECDGHLEDALMLLLMRETGREPDRSLDDLVEKCRDVICQEEIQDTLESGWIALVIEPIASSVGVPPGIATVIAVYVFKKGVKKFCKPLNSES